MSAILIRTLLLTVISALLICSPAAAEPRTVANSPQDICPLPLGSALPEFKVQSLDGKTFDLQAAVRSKPTILIYFRGGW